MKNTVAELDLKIYEKIRKNVSFFLKEQSEIYDLANTKILDIAPQVHKGAKEFFLQSKILTADIDPESNADYIIDICNDNSSIIKTSTFDIVVCSEVLEHTLNPFNAISEIHRILKNEGILFLTTPFNFRIHGPLPDCWRFTEYGLRALLSKFEILSIKPLEDFERFLMPYHYTTIAKKRND